MTNFFIVVKSGTAPDNSLSCNRKILNFCNCVISLGIVPFKLFFFKKKQSKKLEKQNGAVCNRYRFEPNWSSLNSDNLPISEAILPPSNPAEKLFKKYIQFYDITSIITNNKLIFWWWGHLCFALKIWRCCKISHLSTSPVISWCSTRS